MLARQCANVSPTYPEYIGIYRGSYTCISAHVLLNLSNPLEKRIRYIYICIIKKICKKNYIYFIKHIAGQLIQDTNLISILMYHMLLLKHKHSMK